MLYVQENENHLQWYKLKIEIKQRIKIKDSRESWTLSGKIVKKNSFKPKKCYEKCKHKGFL